MRSSIIIGLLLLYLIAVGFYLVRCQRNDPKENPQADLILKNGTFFTVNTRQPRVQAVAIRGDRILAVGRDAEMDPYIGEESQVIDLNGLFGCPGFNDSHIQLLNGGMGSHEIDLRGVTSLREIQVRILNMLHQSPSSSWIVGNGWDHHLLPEGEWPTKRFLDVISPDVPIYLRRVCGHAALVNSKALEIAGITSRTPNPSGGEIVKDPITGNPTGILKGEAMDVVSQYIPLLPVEQIESAIELSLQQIKKYGITSIQDNSDLALLEILRKLQDQGRLTCRVAMCAPLQMDLEKIQKIQQDNNHAWLYASMLYGIMDGSIGSQTAALFDPYLHSTERGLLQMRQEELNRLMIYADQDGFQVSIHAAGIQGNRMVLDAYALAQRINGIRDSRHRIEAVQVLTEEDVARFHQLGIIASVQPSHLMDDIHWIEDLIGQERSRYGYAWGSLKKSGTILAFGSDWPVAPLNPMLGLYAAVARQDTSGYPVGGWHPQERLTIKEAIEAYTLGSAYAEFMDHEKGSLEPGKLADIVILDRDLLEITPEDILKTQVMYTLLGGELIYQHENSE
ncbi:amidohydrolase [bacterium]|nr:amidohydrolase [bacterium]